VAAPSKEAPFGSPRPLPVRNTFIQYGTPIRHMTGIRGTPKTVPHDFAPQAELQMQLDHSLAPLPGAASGSQPAGPLASPMPNTGGRPGPDAWRAGADAAQPNRGRGVAPLRLFDFLPSPTVQAPPSQAPSSQVLQMMPGQAMPVTNFMAPPLPPPPAVPSGNACIGIQAAGHIASPPVWQQPCPYSAAPTFAQSTAFAQQMESTVQAQTSMAPAPAYAPMGYCTDGSQSSNLQPAGMQPVSWPAWNTSPTMVQLPAATAQCSGPVNNPSPFSMTAQGMTMPSSSGHAVSLLAGNPMMAPSTPAMYMQAPMVQQPLPPAPCSTA